RAITVPWRSMLGMTIPERGGSTTAATRHIKRDDTHLNKAEGLPCKHARQPEHDTRIEGDEDRESDQDEQVWQGDLGDIAEALLGQPLYHEQVESHGRCHLSHLDHKHEKDPKPDRVVAGTLNNRHHDRQCHDYHREPVEKAAEDQVEYDQGDYQHERRQ